jgi:small GTP-binding protein
MPRVKAVFAGEAGVGKTCIIERAAHGGFKSNSFATVGATNACVHVSCTIDGKDTTITFNIWDTAGQEKYRSLTPMYFSGAHVAILVFDLTQKDSLQSLHEFYDLLQQRAPEDCLYVLVGNKSDLADRRQVPPDLADQFRLQIGADFYFETSALSGDGIKDMFEKLARAPGLVFEPEEPDYLGIVEEQAPAPGEQKKKPCAC